MPIALTEKVQNNKKNFFYAVFSYFGAIWAPQNGPKKDMQRITNDENVRLNV
jgi:hypothetical protein